MHDATGKAFSNLLRVSVEENLRRLNASLRGSGRALELSITSQETDQNYHLQLWTKDENASLILPRARQNEFGNWVLGERNDRALCPLMLVTAGKARHIRYEEMILHLLFANLEELFPEQSPRSHMERILRGFSNKRGRMAVTSAQRFLNQNLFNVFPLSGTSLQDWAMNRRMMILDPKFRDLRPDEKLAYQVRKNELLHPWGSIGLSDGAAATENYILQADLKDTIAFGRHHNPIRNLYSTLGMKGAEGPLVISQTMAGLEGKGISRGGWNWMTAFLDNPMVFEDQILVDRRHADKEVSYFRSFTIFGDATVVPGQLLTKGKALGLNADESEVSFDIDCDRAVVADVREGVVPFDGLDEPVMVVTVETFFQIKEGVKITNQHGNKGIIALADLGTAIDPVRGEIPIDVVVSAKSIQKRKNFGQVLEALTTLIHGPEVRHVIPDELEVTMEQVEQALIQAGQAKDGTTAIRTPWGEFRTLCGWVHWGITKTPEEQLWEGQDTWTENQRGLRTRGNKISAVELKALTTLLGPKSQTVNEILSHQQGISEVREYLQVLEGMRGNYQVDLPLIASDAIIYLPSGLGTFHELEGLHGTVADEKMYPKGAYLQLPFRLQIRLPDNPAGEIIETLSGLDAYEGQGGYRTFETDRMLIPSFILRQPWLHPTGKYGLSDIATQVNQILEAAERLKLGEIKEAQLSSLVYRYFHSISQGLSSKVGKISTYLMSVRYPWSAKATASLKDTLPENWVEIHRDMAGDLRVTDGDYVLVERFPCLGFMSLRIQRVKVTDDLQCKYVIRVSNNSLVSANLDFDGDVIYVMSLHTTGAKEELKKNFEEPHPRIREVLNQLNNRKQPMTRAMSLPELGLISFPKMTAKEHAELNGRSLAVKLYTGPVIALCYNLQRLVESQFDYEDREAHINVEVFLDKVGNSVFSQKHGTQSLREECTQAICLAEPAALVKLGFPEKESKQLCQAIRTQAAKLGVRTDDELRAHYERHVKEGRSNIINAIVRRFHKAYFATRSNLHPIHLLEHLETAPADMVGHLIQRGLAE